MIHLILNSGQYNNFLMDFTPLQTHPTLILHNIWQEPAYFHTVQLPIIHLILLISEKSIQCNAFRSRKYIFITAFLPLI